MKNIVNLLLISALLFVVSCGSQNQNNNNNDEEFDGSKKLEVVLEDYGLSNEFVEQFNNVGIEEISDIIQSFPSPVEMAALIQSMKVPYSSKVLFNTESRKNFETNFKKAFGLGIYCADLGYLNVYNKTADVIQYLVAIRGLSDDLRIGQFFDFQSLKRLATNADNLDSLLISSVQSYFAMDEYLRNNDRANLSALMVTGVWLETYYLACYIYKEKPSAALKDHIASQKSVLRNLVSVLVKWVNDDPDYAKLLGELKALVDATEGVEITILKEEDVYEEIDGVSVTTQGEKAIINCSDEQINNIVELTFKIRNSVLNKL